MQELNIPAAVTLVTTDAGTCSEKAEARPDIARDVIRSSAIGAPNRSALGGF